MEAVGAGASVIAVIELPNKVTSICAQYYSVVKNAELIWNVSKWSPLLLKRGEQDRGGAALLFTTLAAQLTAKEPDLAGHIKDAFDADPTIITGKAIQDQSEKFILRPLEKLKGNTGDAKKIMLVTDALDECEPARDIRAIIHLLSSRNFGPSAAPSFCDK
ncbi:hypothetical protein MMYC01_207543 [Madurella mycetomatis]|uniref:Nephrocystin 3-like N-terminal domain-containing protein n=1 Tax=Madurella mycetomatis TaxID=100816 RepID=A0A175VZA7_9PEZI|nr:hypothetical protein MMYC01_207543 [Madurella mycetomatis]